MMFCRGTLWTKAKVAPKSLKVWKPNEGGGMLRDWSMDFRTFLIWLSMTCRRVGRMMANRGRVGGRCLEDRRALRALTGQREGFCNSGSWTMW